MTVTIIYKDGNQEYWRDVIDLFHDNSCFIVDRETKETVVSTYIPICEIKQVIAREEKTHVGNA